MEEARSGPPARWSGRHAPVVELDVSTTRRTIDALWRRTSFTDITADMPHPLVTSEPEDTLLADESGAILVARAAVDDGAASSPLAAMPVGRHVGTFVHRVLQATDFAAPDLIAELTTHVAHVPRHVDIGRAADVAAGLAAALRTPLGELTGDRRLCDVARADRLDELEFELPLAGGDRACGSIEPEAVGALLREHLGSGDPLVDYAQRLNDPTLRRNLRGYLTGSIDLVVRLSDGGGTRFAVVDYKTNWLAGPGEPLGPSHYRPRALAAEMLRAHYGLQALLYLVAAHRYLRWRMPGYEPQRNLGGALYLFLRGMTGPDTPQMDGGRCGVFTWQPPARLVEELSDLLDHATSR